MTLDSIFSSTELNMMHDGTATTIPSFGQIRGPTRCICQETSTTPTPMAGTPASQKRVQLATARQRLTPEARSIRILPAKAFWLVISAVVQTRPARCLAGRRTTRW